MTTRRRRLRAVVPGLPVLLCLVVAACVTPAPAVALGVVPASCTPDRTDALASAGVRWAGFDVAWARWEPAAGTRDDSYVEQVRRRLQVCSSRGLKVVLGMGLQYPPGWVRGLPGAEYREQHGNASPTGPVNLVFSRAVRTAAGAYMRDLVGELGPASIDAVRIGTSVTGELGYLGPDEGPTPDLHDFWAFDDAAQTGAGLADGQAPSPLPGWVPGQTTWRGSSLGPERTRDWFLWYERALADCARWQVETLLATGYSGAFHLVLAGRGTSPRELDAAVSDRLGGEGDPQGSLERGLYYPDQIARLGAVLAPRIGRDRLVVDVTGLDDTSTVRARALVPPTDRCRPDDPDRVLDAPGVETWPSYRFTAAVGRRAGLRLVGENPGTPSSSATGGSGESDPLVEQLRRAPAYARGCGLETFFFAFEDDLFDARSGVRPDDLGATAGTP